MATWVVERTQDRRIPFRISIEQEQGDPRSARVVSQEPLPARNSE
jgi:hypothetical protein